MEGKFDRKRFDKLVEEEEMERKKTKGVATHKQMKKLLAQVDTSKHLWMVAEAAALPKSSVSMSSVSFTVDFAKGLGAKGLVAMANKEEADKVLEMWEKERTKSIAAAQMIQAEPLLQNLKVKQDKEKIAFESMVNDSQLDKLLLSFRQLMAVQMQAGAN